MAMSLEELYAAERVKYPTDPESEDDATYSKRALAKKAKRMSSDEELALELDSQSYLNGRRPLTLLQSVDHVLKLGQKFVSRWDGELYIASASARCWSRRGRW